MSGKEYRKCWVIALVMILEDWNMESGLLYWKPITVVCAIFKIYVVVIPFVWPTNESPKKCKLLRLKTMMLQGEGLDAEGTYSASFRSCQGERCTHIKKKAHHMLDFSRWNQSKLKNYHTDEEAHTKKLETLHLGIAGEQKQHTLPNGWMLETILQFSTRTRL